MTTTSLTADMPHLLAAGILLMSIWKPLLLIVTIIPWALMVSRVYDKHAARFFLPRRKWNLFHMLMGVAAIVGAISAGLAVDSEAAFWIGWGVMLVILTVDLAAYAVAANRDERVPEEFHIRFDMSAIKERRAQKAAAKLQATVALSIKGPNKKILPAPMQETPEFEVRVAAERVYQQAMEARASQVDIGPTGRENVYGVSHLVDGVRQASETMPAADALRIMDFWKAAAGLDVSDRRRKQSGEVTVESESIKHVAKVTSIGSQGGMRFSMLFDPKDAVTRRASELGLLDMQLAELKAIVADGRGVVLQAAPPDGGRTTTLYAITQLHDAYTSNVQTLEIEPTKTVEGVRTNTFNPLAEGAEFSTTLRSILRRDPDVVSVADLPDANTAKEAARSDHDRTRVYLSLKGDNALLAIQAYVKAVGDAREAADALHGALAQKLLRKLCTNCRVAYPPSADMLKKLGIPEGKVQQLFKKGGQVMIKNKPEVCPVCHGSGYFGQEGVFEVYAIGPEERELIAAGNFQGLKAQFRKRGLPTLQQAALRKAVDGTTSVEEVMRITTREHPSGTAGKAAVA